MNPIACFWLLFAILLICIVYCNNKFGMLKDLSEAAKKPYSWSRVQLAWWTIIIIASFTTIVILNGEAPELRLSTVILLGITAATIATATTIDTAEKSEGIVRHQDNPGTNFIIDILSDQTGVSIHRFQTVVFNLVFGIWFISQVMKNLVTAPTGGINFIMPDIEQNNLILLGLSSATYAVMKTTENKGKASLANSTVTTVTNPTVGTTATTTSINTATVVPGPPTIVQQPDTANDPIQP